MHYGAIKKAQQKKISFRSFSKMMGPSLADPTINWVIRVHQRPALQNHSDIAGNASHISASISRNGIRPAAKPGGAGCGQTGSACRPRQTPALCHHAGTWKPWPRCQASPRPAWQPPSAWMSTRDTQCASRHALGNLSRTHERYPAGPRWRHVMSYL